MGTAASSQSAPVLFLAAASQAPHVSEGDRDHNRGIAICNCGQAERVCDILDVSLLLTRDDHVSLTALSAMGRCSYADHLEQS